MAVLVIAVIAGCIIPPENAPSPIKPKEMNWINVSGSDILPSSGVIRVEWNYTGFDSNFPDCYVRIYGWMHTPLIDEYKIVGIQSLNKTGIMNIIYHDFPDGVYFVNLQCQMDKEPYDSMNLDIVPVFIDKNPGKAARDAGIKQVQDYVTCKNMPGVNCREWQQLAAQGRNWNQSLGVPI